MTRLEIHDVVSVQIARKNYAHEHNYAPFHSTTLKVTTRDMIGNEAHHTVVLFGDKPLEIKDA